MREYYVQSTAFPLLSIDSDGSNGFVQLNGLAIDTNGVLYFVDTGAARILKCVFDSSGNYVLTNFAGHYGSTAFVDGIGSNAYFNYPVQVAVDSGGVLYVTDVHNSAIRAISSTGRSRCVMMMMIIFLQDKLQR